MISCDELGHPWPNMAMSRDQRATGLERYRKLPAVKMSKPNEKVNNNKPAHVGYLTLTQCLIYGIS